MDKPKIFYEDNKIGKKRLTILGIVLSVCVVGWTLAMILSFVIPMPEGFPKNNFQDKLADNITIIVFLILLLATVIALFIYRSKARRFKYALSITEDELVFTVPVNGKDKFNSKEFVSYEIINKLNEFAKVKLIFQENTETIIRTRKYDELKIALDNLGKSSEKQEQIGTE